MSHEYNESLIERERILIDVFFWDFASNVIDISLYCFTLYTISQVLLYPYWETLSNHNHAFSILEHI